MKPFRLALFVATFLAAGVAPTSNRLLGQFYSCGSIGSNCYRAYCDNRIYEAQCCNGYVFHYNSNDCWSRPSAHCVQSCWTEGIHTTRCPIAACGDDSFSTNWCYIEGCRSPVFR